VIPGNNFGVKLLWKTITYFVGALYTLALHSVDVSAGNSLKGH